MNRRDALTLLAAAGLISGCTTPTDHSTPSPPDVIDIVAVPGGYAATSSQHGPFEHRDVRAVGFTHDAVGAAVAATHIGARVTAAAGPEVAMATIATQCWGDLAAARRRLGALLPAAGAVPQPELAPVALWFRVVAGDPGGEQVVVSLLADTPQSRAAGGLARVDATLLWNGTDWQLRVPPARASVHPSSEGYQLLAPTGADA